METVSGNGYSCGPIGQPVFHHQMHRQADHTVRVVTARGSHVRHVGVEILSAFRAAVNEIGPMFIVWTTRDQHSQYRAGLAFLGGADRRCIHNVGTASWGKSRLRRMIFGLGRSLGSVMPSVASGRYSPGPGMGASSVVSPPSCQTTREIAENTLPIQIKTPLSCYSLEKNSTSTSSSDMGRRGRSSTRISTARLRLASAC